MKTQLFLVPLFAAFCVAPSASSGQTPANFAYHQHDGEAGDLLAAGNQYFYVSDLSPSSACGNSVTMISLNSNGQVQWTLPITKPAPVVRTGNLIMLSGGDLLLAGLYHGTDVPAPSEKVFLMRVSTSGQKIFDVDFANHGGLWTVPSVAEAPDGSFYVTQSNKLYHLDGSGTLLSTRTLSISGSTALMMLAGDRLLLNTTQSHVLIDTSGTTITSVASAKPVYQYGKTSSGSVIAIDDSCLVKYTPGLTVTGTFTVPQKGAKKMAIRNDSIHLVTATHRYLVLDTSLTVVHSYSLQMHDRSTDGIALNGGQVGFVSNAGGRQHSLNPTSYSTGRDYAITLFPVNQGFLYTKDVGVVGVSCATCIGSYYVPTPSVAVINLSLSANVIVKNYGADTVKSFFLTCDRFRPYMCGISYYHEKFNVAPLPPGGTVQVTTSPLLLYAESTSPVTSYQFNDIGYFTTAPDDKVDLNSANDLVSTNVNFVVTGLREHLYENAAVRLYPNPAGSSVAYDCDFTPRAIRITGIDGRELQRIEVAGRNGQLDISHLAAGVYLIHLYSNEGRAIKKLVRE